MKAYRPKPPPIPTTEKLAQALAQAGAPGWMIADARAGRYDDFKSQSATPILDLVHEAEAHGLHDLVRRAKAGEFDATTAEAEAWAQSPDGRAAFRQLRRGR